MQVRCVLLVLCIAGCETREPVEAMIDAPVAQPGEDAPPYMCTPVAPALPPACLALTPGTLAGTTPLGTIDVDLDYFGAGDCISHAIATVGLRGACGEVVGLQFSYPVTSDTTGRRRVANSFDATARFQLEPPGAAVRERVTMVHVDVVQWQEGQDVHDIDITVTVTDPLFGLTPLHIQGTFCDWPFYLC